MSRRGLSLEGDRRLLLVTWYGFRVKTTLNIDDEIMWWLQEEAARRRTTISALVEAGLRCVLVAPPAVTGERIAPLPPLPRWDSGGKLISIDDRDELYRAMEEK